MLEQQLSRTQTKEGQNEHTISSGVLWFIWLQVNEDLEQLEKAPCGMMQLFIRRGDIAEVINKKGDDKLVRAMEFWKGFRKR